MNLDIIITGAIGIITSIISALLSWFTARRKYNSEVDSNEIDNLKKSLDMYISIIEDTKNKLDFYIKINKENMVEVHRLKGSIHRVLNSACLNTECAIRKFYTKEQIETILHGNKEESENGVNTREEVL
jgi:hypothetical protein